MKLLAFSLVFLVFVACGFGQSEIQLVTGDTKVEKIARLLEAYDENGQFNGTVLVALDDEVVYERAFGFANLEWEIPNTVDARFRIASLTKAFTAILVLQQVEEGVLDLNGHVSDYLPDYPKPNGELITIHHLLSHRAGLIDFPDVPENFDIRERLRHGREGLFAYFADREPLFPPGSRFRYSNFGYVLLAFLLQEVTDQSYGKLIGERILEPAGMKDTGMDDNDSILPKRAAGYHAKLLTGPENAPYLDMSVVLGGGCLYSTVRDLFLFDQAFRGGELLSGGSTLRMLSHRYGRSIEQWPTGDSGKTTRAMGGNGSINGFASTTRRFAVGDQVAFVAALRNIKGVGGGQTEWVYTGTIAKGIAAILHDVDCPLPLPSAAACAGRALLAFYASADRVLADLREDSIGPLRFEENEFRMVADRLAELDRHAAAHDLLKTWLGRSLEPADPRERTASLALLAGLCHLVGDEKAAEQAVEAMLASEGFAPSSDGYRLLNGVGRRLLGLGEAGAAIAVLERNVRAFPGIAGAYVSLGEAYLADGQTEPAIMNLEKSLDLDSRNQRVLDLLDAILGDGEDE